MLQRGHSGNGCDLGSTLCKYDSRKACLFYVCCSDCVGVCVNVCCATAIGKDSGLPWSVEVCFLFVL